MAVCDYLYFPILRSVYAKQIVTNLNINNGESIFFATGDGNVLTVFVNYMC